MIRPFTVLCLLTACGSGLYLYSEKHRTALLDRDIGHVIHASAAAQARTGMLRAEWALLNEPGRLEDMAGRYLTLHPMAPTQFVQLASLASHLPAPMATPANDVQEDDATPTPDTPVAAVSAETPAAMPPTSPSVANKGSLLAAKVDAKADGKSDRTDAKPAAKLLAAANPRLHVQRRLALNDRQDYGARDGMLARGAPLPLAAPQPMGASVYSAMARPMRVSAQRPAIVSAVPSYAPARAYVPSALGNAGSLPPPVPYGR